MRTEKQLTCPNCRRKAAPQVGVVWERVNTSKHGSATYSYAADDYYMRERRLVAALRRAVGHTVAIGWGHYGYAPKTGGLNPEGTYRTERIAPQVGLAPSRDRCKVCGRRLDPEIARAR